MQMPKGHDVQHEAHLLAEELRSYRAAVGRTRGGDLTPLRAMEARLAALRADIRAARAAPGASDADRGVRRTRPAAP